MSNDTAVIEPSPEPSPPRTTAGDRVRFVLRGIGQTLITAGLVVLLFVVYEVWITNIFATRAQHRVHQTLEKNWARGDDPLLPLPGTTKQKISFGTGIANLYLPRLGVDYQETIVQGTNDSALEKGPGHYAGTALPGQIGNFAIAGHRVGKGEPFLNLDRLRAGDPVIVETRSTWFVYRVKGSPVGGNPQGRPDADGLPGREIVDPSAGRVLLPMPDHPGQKATERLMTMTTCHPKFTAAQRMIVYSYWVHSYPRTSATMPAPVKALYREVGN